MNAWISIIDSVLRIREPATPAVEAYGAIKQTVGVTVVGISGQDELTVVHRLLGRPEALWVFFVSVRTEVSEKGGRKARRIQSETEIWPRKICQQTTNPKKGWARAAIYTLLVSCFALTLFSVFQAPIRLRANENLANPMILRTEIAALPATLKTHAVSRLRAPGSQQNAGYSKADNPIDDSPPKRRVPREHPFQQRQSQESIRSGQFSDRN